jgi:hypothetical protein
MLELWFGGYEVTLLFLFNVLFNHIVPCDARVQFGNTIFVCFIFGSRALAIRKLNGILAMSYYLGCIYIFWSQSSPRITKGVVGMYFLILRIKKIYLIWSK